MKFISFLIVLLFFTGCVQDRSFGIFTKDKIYQKAIKYTQKGDIINKEETKAIIIATYLNQIYDEFKKEESFYVGIYLNDENSNKNSALKDSSYKIKLNSLKPISIVEVDKNSKYHKELPFINSWFTYYIINFESSKSKELNLNLENEKVGKTTLKFLKQER